MKTHTLSTFSYIQSSHGVGIKQQSQNHCYYARSERCAQFLRFKRE